MAQSLVSQLPTATQKEKAGFKCSACGIKHPAPESTQVCEVQPWILRNVPGSAQPMHFPIPPSRGLCPSSRWPFCNDAIFTFEPLERDACLFHPFLRKLCFNPNFWKTPASISYHVKWILHHEAGVYSVTPIRHGGHTAASTQRKT